MAYRNSLDNLLSKSMALQLAADCDIEEDHVKLLFPNLFKRSVKNNRRLIHASVQTTPQVDPTQVPWILDLEKKAEHLCVKLSNILNSVYNHQSYRRYGYPSTGEKKETDVYDLKFKAKYGFRYPVKATSDYEVSRKTELNIEDSLMEILKLAREVRNAIPVVGYDTTVEDIKPKSKPLVRSLIPERANPRNKRVDDLLAKYKPRRSNTVPDFFDTVSFQGGHNIRKLQTSLEATNKITSATEDSKIKKKVSSENKPCPHCGNLNVRIKNEPSSSGCELSSESVSCTGAIPKKQPIASSKPKMKRTASQRPRWK